MNSESIWAVIAAFIGGVFVGVVAANAMAGKEYREALKRAENRNERLSRRIDELSNKNEKLVDTMDKQVSTSLSNSLEGVRTLSPDYLRLSRKYKDPDFDEHFGEHDHPRDDDEVRPPFRMNEDEAETSLSDKTMISYYPEDDVLVDENGTPIEDPSDICGNVLSELRFIKEDEVFIQNDPYDTIYVILIQHGMSYHKDILGEDMTITEE